MRTQNFGYIWRKDGVSGGAACLDGTGILVSFIAKRFAAGESVSELAADYDVQKTHIEAALRLVLYARGTNLHERRAAARINAAIPLLSRRRV